MNKTSKKIILDDIRGYLRTWNIVDDKVAQEMADKLINKYEEQERPKKQPIRVFLSLPMSGRSDDEIKAQINVMKAEFLLKNPFGNGKEIIFVHNFSEKECVTNTFDPFFGERKTPALYYLGRAIHKMTYCDAVYVGDGFTKARGCMIEYRIAMDYQIPVYHNVEDLIKEVK